MRVFVDQCVDWRLARNIVGHEVKTARQMGWSTIENGELLALAAKENEVARKFKLISTLLTQPCVNPAAVDDNA